jgi:Asp-tRNA(Asn)/Glu-tRNA(Gln) amidotransferase A subunit family amidase
MGSTDLNELSAIEIQMAVARGDLSCEQVARSCLERIAARDAVVKAWAFLDPEATLAQARRLDSAAVRGRLHGVPVGVKDVIDTFDMPTEMGSPIYRGHRPIADASCVALLRAEGALVLGKTVTCEFAGPAPAQTTNPHDPQRTPGGSSSGSAAAVADYMVPLAFGTQTGGSILRPAAYCGVVGFKPTFGMINPRGVKPAAESLDTIGLLARTVEDVALAMSVLVSADEATWLPATTRIRIGLCRTHAWDTADDATKKAVMDAASRLGSEGHVVEDITLPAAWSKLSATREIVNDYERARAIAHEWRTSPDLISSELAQSIRRGFAMPAERYIGALRDLEVCRQALEPLFEVFDVLLAPTVSSEAPLGLSHTGDHQLQSIWTQLRTPAIHLPTHAGPNGMPIGIQLVGRPYGDRELLAFGRLIFKLLGHGPVVSRDQPLAPARLLA